VGDTRSARDLLGWETTLDFETGFRLTVDWFHDDPTRVPFYEGRQSTDTC
jgi:dTDP-D-glucose 4,6-dehydratase